MPFCRYALPFLRYSNSFIFPSKQSGPGKTGLFYFTIFKPKLNLIPIFFLLLTCSHLNQSTALQAGKLTGKTITIKVSYSAIECECARWVETKDSKTPGAERFYLEPANKGLVNADALWDGEHLPLQLRLTGQFYTEKKLPINYKPAKGSPVPARVFRYQKIEILSPYYSKQGKHS